MIGRGRQNLRNNNDYPSVAAPASLATGAITADVLVTLIVITGMILDRYSVTMAVLSGVTFFLLFGSLVMLTLSGTLTAIVTSAHQQGTERRLHVLQYNHTKTLHKPSVALLEPVYEHPVSLALPQQNFVAPVPEANEQLKMECYTFVRALFDDEGRLLPRRVLGENTRLPGLVQYAKPREEVVEYLASLGMVSENERRQLFFDVARYPTLRHCIVAIRHDTPAGRGG